VRLERSSFLPLTFYADPDSDVIGEGGGMERLFADLGVDPEDTLTLIFAWQMKASMLGEFTRQEWTEGMVYLKYFPNSLSAGADSAYQVRFYRKTQGEASWSAGLDQRRPAIQRVLQFCVYVWQE
jgi:hypothetical protein